VRALLDENEVAISKTRTRYRAPTPPAIPSLIGERGGRSRSTRMPPPKYNLWMRSSCLSRVCAVAKHKCTPHTQMVSPRVRWVRCAVAVRNPAHTTHTYGRTPDVRGDEPNIPTREAFPDTHVWPWARRLI
jgi:hypothetical protein